MFNSTNIDRIVRVKFYYKSESEILTVDILERDLEEGETLDGVVNYMLKNNIIAGYHVYSIDVKLGAKRTDKKIKKGWFRK